MRASVKLLVVLILVQLCGCAIEDQLSIVVDVDPVRWREPAQFSIINDDTLSRREISVFVRCQPSKEYVDSLPLHVVTTSPDQLRVVEQHTIYFDHTAGDQWQRRQYREEPYRKDVTLRQSGEYKIMIYPQQPTQGVEAVGVVIKSRE